MQDDPEQPQEPQPVPVDATEPDAFADFDEDEGSEAEREDGYTAADFHTVIHKQVVNATIETLSSAKLDWDLIEPFLLAAREICRGDFRRTGRLEVHGVTAEGGALVEAEEAYVSVSVADQDDGAEWLSETWWLSDAVLASGDPERVREAARALEKSLARLNAWLEEHAATGPGEAG